MTAGTRGHGGPNGVWGLKARVEERLLAARYPVYAGYCSRTRYRLCPFVY